MTKTFKQVEGNSKGRRVEVIKEEKSSVILSSLETGITFKVSLKDFSKFYEEEGNAGNRSDKSNR